MSFTDQKPFVATAEDTQRKWGGGFWCKLCSQKFTAGLTVRFVLANGIAGMKTGNFFVCQTCDGPDVLTKAKESYDQAVKLSKQWGIYGPDWQQDFHRHLRDTNHEISSSNPRR